MTNIWLQSLWMVVVRSLSRVWFFAASWAVFPVAKGCLVWGWQPQNICCLVYHDREAEMPGDTRENQSWQLFKHVKHIKHSVYQCGTQGEFQPSLSTWQVGVYSQSPLIANVYSMSAFLLFPVSIASRPARIWGHRNTRRLLTYQWRDLSGIQNLE